MKKITDKEYKELKVLHSKMDGLYEKYINTVNDIQDKIIDLLEEELSPVIDEFNENVDELQSRVNKIYEEIEKTKPIPFVVRDKNGKRLDWSVYYNTVQYTELDHIHIVLPLEDIEIYDLPNFNEDN